MKNKLRYSLLVSEPHALMRLLIDRFSPETLISFEGTLKGFSLPEYVYATEAHAPLRRSTISPETDFWVFRLDAATKRYLKEDFLERVGLRGPVFHIVAAEGEHLVFESYDGFAHCFITLDQSARSTDEFLMGMLGKGMISSFESSGE